MIFINGCLVTTVCNTTEFILKFRPKMLRTSPDVDAETLTRFTI